MEYIPSKYTYSQVLEILEREKNKEKDLKKNYRYIMLKCCHFGNFVGAFIFMLFIISQFIDNHITYLFPWEKAMRHFSETRSAMHGAATASLYYLYFWIVLIILIYKTLSTLIKRLYQFYIKKGLIVPNKYGGRTGTEIKTIYESMEQFIDYITQNPELTEKDFQIDEAGTHLVRTIHHMDGDEKIEFYFGPHLKEIIIDHTVLDFSKLDAIYGL